MGTENKLDIAASAWTALEKLHQEFVTHVAGLSNPKVNGGSIGCVDGELVAACLGIALQTKHRPVARDGHLMAVEYVFVAPYHGKDVDILVMYLDGDENLYLDLARNKSICQAHNTRLPKYIVELLANALLRSTIFSPKQVTATLV